MHAFTEMLCLLICFCFCRVCNFKTCLLQWTVCGRTGGFGANVTSAVVAELGHEPDRAQTLLLPMVVTIVMDRQKKRQTV